MSTDPLEGRTPTEYLILEVLAARHRTGEPFWPFPSRFLRQLRSLKAAGLVTFESAVTAGDYRAGLTVEGRKAAVSEGYVVPAAREWKARAERAEAAVEALRGLVGKP